MKNERNEELIVSLRSDLSNLKVFENQLLIDTLTKYVEQYKEPNMEKFEYLKDSIEPQPWVVILCWVLEIFGLIGLSVYFHKNEIF